MSVMSSVHPAIQAAMSRKEKAIKWSLVIAVAAVLALLMLMILVATAGVGVLPLAILLAFFPLPLYLAYALWIDRYEPEPRWSRGGHARRATPIYWTRLRLA